MCDEIFGDFRPNGVDLKRRFFFLPGFRSPGLFSQQL